MVRASLTAAARGAVCAYGLQCLLTAAGLGNPTNLAISAELQWTPFPLAA